MDCLRQFFGAHSHYSPYNKFMLISFSTRGNNLEFLEHKVKLSAFKTEKNMSKNSDILSWYKTILQKRITFKYFKC